ncbi:MAG: tyrosine-protein phosphatase [Candidatus Portnoybacteria bacterium]|nr:tyrosine-protein phosphatase [Candidatus Portnoybacteria bacterium]
MPARFTEVVPEKLYRGGAPSIMELPILQNKWGIKQIISLDEKSAKNIASTCKNLGLKHIILPIHSATIDGKDPIMDKINNLGVSNILNDIPSYVHCKHGKDRTGMFIARFKTENGWDAKKAIEEAVLFGFGVGVDDDSVNLYLNVINNGPDAEEPVTLDYVKSLQSDLNSTCNGCGLLKKNNEPCYSCEADKSVLKNLVDVSRGDSLYTFQNPGDSTSVSNLWDADYAGGSELWNIEGNMATASKYDKKTRKGLISALQKVAQEISGQEISKQVSEVDKENTKILIENLDTFLKLIDSLINNQLKPFIDLFKNTQGITHELIEEVEAEPYFTNLGKNLKKNVWRLVGNRYIDLLDDIDENKNKKENTQSEQQQKIEEDKIQTLFDLCLQGLSSFNKDTHIGPMQKSLEEAVKGLADLVVTLSDYLENSLDNEDMQQHVLAMFQGIQNQVATIKTLIKDRIIYTLDKDVLGKDKPYEDEKANMSVLKSVINKTHDI